MHQPNADVILARLEDSDRVLDVGGWARPFSRADAVVDILPYATRGIYGRVGGGPERFTERTWHIHDISSAAPLPFADKEFDFVTCSHVLEDIRDPILLCREMIRVGKAGYVEVPARVVDMTMGVENDAYAGYYHHRWLVDIEDNQITFSFKSGLLYDSWKCHLPKSYLKLLKEEDKVSWLFWTGSFEYREALNLGGEKASLERYVRQRRAYPEIFYFVDELMRPRALLRKIVRGSPILHRLFELATGRRLVDKAPTGWAAVPVIYSK